MMAALIPMNVGGSVVWKNVVTVLGSLDGTMDLRKLPGEGEGLVLPSQLAIKVAT